MALASTETGQDIRSSDLIVRPSFQTSIKAADNGFHSIGQQPLQLNRVLDSTPHRTHLGPAAGFRRLRRNGKRIRFQFGPHSARPSGRRQRRPGGIVPANLSANPPARGDADSKDATLKAPLLINSPLRPVGARPHPPTNPGLSFTPPPFMKLSADPWRTPFERSSY